MESESGAKIAIRGKGSVKEGKGRSDAAHSSNQEEDLHCLIMADTEEKVNKAKKLIHNVIETVSNPVSLRRLWSFSVLFPSSTHTNMQAASIPEGQNELKRNQLRELAALNGTLRDDENQACQNCGQIGHRKYDCPERQNYTASIICRVCGNAGHMARDCPDRQRGASWRNDGPGRTAGRIGGGDAVDREYEVCLPACPLNPVILHKTVLTGLQQLMQELGGGSSNGGAPARIEAGPGSPSTANNDQRSEARPWQRGPTGGPAPWRVRNNDSNHEGGGSAAPWARDRNRGNDDHKGGDTYYGGGRTPATSQGSAGSAPWHRPPGMQNGYGGYPGYSGYGAAPPPPAPPGMNGPPPGLPPPPGAPGVGAPPSMPGNVNTLIQQYSGGGGVPPPPPPPPSDNVPPPPPSDQPPPPPPPGA